MATVWLALILLCLLLYVVLDGYDLGLGIATLFERDAATRHRTLEEVAVAWDGNETWLVLLGVSLWAGFPLAFGTILPHAYLAVIVLLFSLIVRGVSTEMASQAAPAPRWVRAFGIASLTAALAEGVVLGTLTQKLTLVGGAFSGSPFGAVGWFCALGGVTVACVYLALGYAYLKAKTTDELRERAARRGTVAALAATLLAIPCFGAVNATAAPLKLHGPVRSIAFVCLLLFAAGGLATAFLTLRPSSRYDLLPLAGLVTAVVAAVVAVVVARYPVLAAPSLTVADSSAPSTTLTFLAVGIGLNVPLILFYNWFAHHAFRGRLDAASNGRDPRPARSLP